MFPCMQVLTYREDDESPPPSPNTPDAVAGRSRSIDDRLPIEVIEKILFSIPATPKSL